MPTSKNKKPERKAGRPSKKSSEKKTMPTKAKEITKEVTKKTIKKKWTTIYTAHKKTSKKWSNFALWLLLVSIVLFIFSLYKAFWQHNKPEIIQETTKTVTIEPYISSWMITSWTLLSWTTLSWTTLSGEVISWNSIIPTTLNNETGQIESITNTEDAQQINYTFSQAFKKEEKHKDIWMLQQFLITQWFYSWDITEINNAKTREALYNFQKKHEIIKSDTPRNVRWYLGPSTRAKIHSITNKDD